MRKQWNTTSTTRSTESRQVICILTAGEREIGSVITTHGKEVMAEVGSSRFGDLSGICSKMYSKHVTITQLHTRIDKAVLALEATLEP